MIPMTIKARVKAQIIKSPPHIGIGIGSAVPVGPNNELLYKGSSNPSPNTVI